MPKINKIIGYFKLLHYTYLSKLSQVSQQLNMFCLKQKDIEKLMNIETLDTEHFAEMMLKIGLE